MDMEEHYFCGQENIKEIQKIMVEVQTHALCRPNEKNKIIIDRINRDLAELYALLEF